MMRSLSACGVLCCLVLAACSGFKSSEPAVQTYVLRPALPGGAWKAWNMIFSVCVNRLVSIFSANC